MGAAAPIFFLLVHNFIIILYVTFTLLLRNVYVTFSAFSCNFEY